ncbi:1,5-anhydro-D-fructose reductase-like [Leptopilina heterotoma]|uniref:1,5-anhydro-D-fructose reductase-like n=1 Tax=Leptopilina heterotoma TaxID=63436 RepID=UPI001CA958BB|nr:1,5-anhydro-D-fructose reductase-like [Leptopilina heterotoma]
MKDLKKGTAKGSVTGLSFRNYHEDRQAKNSVEKVIDLPRGGKLPIVGFGTWSAFASFSDEEVETAVNAALEAGYRLIDCARAYFNEKAIGNVLKKWIDSGKITRDELFIVSKLPPTGNRPSGVEKHLNQTLNDLQLDYLDLYLIHVPWTFEEVGDELIPFNEDGEVKLDMSTDNEATWKEMEKQVNAGKVRAIGLSNFNIQQIERINNISEISVSVIQMEMHVYCQQRELLDFCKLNGIAVMANSPLGSPGLAKFTGKPEANFYPLKNPTVQTIAQKHEKTPAQVLLRFLIQKGVSVIPKSSKPHRIQENFKVLDWTLDSSDMTALESLDKGPEGRVVDFVSFFKGVEKHPEFPFKTKN